MRLFLAIDLPDEARARLQAIQRDIRDARIVPPENFHLTLVFLGEAVGREVAGEIDEALGGARLSVPEITLAGIGHFGREAPRAVWVGAEPRDELARLSGKLSGLARRAGAQIPARRFVPHVTLARFRGHPADAGAVARMHERHGALRLDPFRPEAVHLMRSHLSRSGADYEVCASYAVN